MNKKAILVVSFGSSYESARIKAIQPIEKFIENTFKEFKVMNAYTSNFVREKLKKQDIHVDSVSEALKKLIASDFLEIYIQPLHILAGFEYEKIQRAVKEINQEAVSIKLGEPLLNNDKDIDAMVSVLNDHKDYLTVYIGHGTEHPMHGIYEQLESRLKTENQHIFVGTIEEGPDAMVERLQVLKTKENIEYDTVLLKPFLLVAGDHVIKDIDSSSKESWVSTFKRKGYHVMTDLRGLGELESIQQLFLSKVYELTKEGV